MSATGVSAKNLLILLLNSINTELLIGFDESSYEVYWKKIPSTCFFFKTRNKIPRQNARVTTN